MSDRPDTPAAPEPPAEPEAGPQVGVDSWVASHEGRSGRGGLLGWLARTWESIPDAVKLLAFVGIAASLPFWLLTSEGDLFNFGLFTLLFIGFGLGLNVDVGWAGLLDLGYVAALGIGAYTYAILSSGYYGIHWPAEVTLPIAMGVAMIPATILGFSARRLLGDYLAIVTLFFAEAFLVFANVANPTIFGKGLTGGANGIPQLDPLTFFGHAITSTKGLYFFLLGAVAVVAAALYLANQSRTGRAWRASREDPLAAEVMSMPVNRLRISAFIFSWAVAGLFGAIYAAILTATVSTNFSIGLLITIYAVIILGGLGSIAGVVVGAIIINCVFVFLEPQTDHPGFKRWLFYVTIILLIALLKPWYKAVVVYVGTIASGFIVHAVVGAWAGPAWTSGKTVNGASWLSHWVVIPKVAHGNINNILYIGLVAAIVLVATLKGWWRIIALGPTLYLTAVVWENVLSENPGVTALILFGAMLVGLMITRPQGLLGQARVEIV
ncbi:MAG TPA: branched-chain amino acid ABC transporter permease [Gaiellaceae bacterium]|nr:branched-chain amino acid ABC transporter permease [Gaiellaceae bacterium]